MLRAITDLLWSTTIEDDAPDDKQDTASDCSDASSTTSEEPIAIQAEAKMPDMPLTLGSTAEIVVVITNNSEGILVEVSDFELLTEHKSLKVDDIPTTILNAKQKCELSIAYIPTEVESYTALVAWKANNRHFFHSLHVSSADEVAKRIVETAKPRVKRSEFTMYGKTESVGERLPMTMKLPPYAKLKPYDLPTTEFASAAVAALQKKIQNGANLGPVTYEQILSAGLYAEEHGLAAQMEQYNISNAKLRREGRLFAVAVSGLAERRPSVLRNDRVRVQTSKGSPVHIGFVHDVRQNDILVSFSKKFASSFSPTTKYKLGFLVNRVQFRLQHRAVEQASTEVLRTLFPTAGAKPPPKMKPVYPSQISFRNVGLNFRQKQAVASVLSRDALNDKLISPFVIFGPPGTGKTTTLVEAILQVLKKHPSSKILVTAPSNAAVDVALKAFIEQNRNEFVPESLIFRANATFRSVTKTELASIRPYSLYNDAEKIFCVPQDLPSYRVVFSTLSFTGTICMLTKDRSFVPDYIFIDEAGHATEAESVVPISAAWKNRKQKVPPRVVLAGDPKQLGPVTHSPLVQSLGLHLSMLERLMRCKPYQLRGKEYDASFVVDLRDNYRSHLKLLELPSRLFYNNLLTPKAAPKEVNTFVGWNGLPNPRVPLILHGVLGRHHQEGRSPSYFNPQEISVVVSMVNRILKAKRCNPRDIGVITPYVGQCQKIRSELRQKYPEIRVGTVEAFQGDERDVIIISTVRSTKALQQRPSMQARDSFRVFDERFNLGFLNNPKRFNVSWTRARSLVVLVGNPNLYNCDPVWKEALQFATKHCCCEGAVVEVKNAV